MDNSSGREAAVIGGSIAGLLAWRFERVTVLERDQLPEQPGLLVGRSL